MNDFPPPPPTLTTTPPADLPSPPFILLPGLPNLRDTGGYPLANPPTPLKRSTRRHLLFRSADPSAAPTHPTTATALTQTLRLTTAFDLRSSAEVTRALFGPPLALPGLARVHAPTNAEDMSPAALAARFADYAHGGDDGFVRAYADILRSAGPAVRAVALHLVRRPDAPVLVHCTAGKDRTAIVVMLLLRAAGVDGATVAREYALTQQGLGSVRGEIVKWMLARPDMNGDREAAERAVGSRAEAMLLTLDLLEREWGGADAWLKTQAGLTDEELAELKDVLTSEEESIL